MLTAAIPGGADDKMQSTINSVSLFPTGQFYVQYGASTAIATSTVETSLLNNTSTTVSNFGTNFPNDTSTLTLVGSQNPLNSVGTLTLGTYFRGRVIASVNNTSTPTLRIRTVLKNSAGTIVYTLADSGAQTMTAITSGPRTLEYTFESIVSSVGTTGTMVSWCQYTYDTNVTVRQSVGGTGVVASQTVDTTATYTLDILATWGTSSSSNTITTLLAHVGVVG
jgi:hypothetical protein